MPKLMGGMLIYAIVIVLVVAGLSAFSLASNGKPDAVEVVDCWTNDIGLGDPPNFDKEVASCTCILADNDGDGLADCDDPSCAKRCKL